MRGRRGLPCACDPGGSSVSERRACNSNDDREQVHHAPGYRPRARRRPEPRQTPPAPPSHRPRTAPPSYVSLFQKYYNAHPSKRALVPGPSRNRHTSREAPHPLRFTVPEILKSPVSKRAHLSDPARIRHTSREAPPRPASPFQKYSNPDPASTATPAVNTPLSKPPFSARKTTWKMRIFQPRNSREFRTTQPLRPRRKIRIFRPGIFENSAPAPLRPTQHLARCARNATSTITRTTPDTDAIPTKYRRDTDAPTPSKQGR